MNLILNLKLMRIKKITKWSMMVRQNISRRDPKHNPS